MNLPDGEYPIDLSSLRKKNAHKILQLKFSSNTNNGSALNRIDSTKFEIIGNRTSKNYYIYSDDSGDNNRAVLDNKDLLMEVSNLKSKDSEFILVLNKEKQLSLVKLSNIIRINKSRISKKTQAEMLKIRNNLNEKCSDSVSSTAASKKVVSSRKQTPNSETTLANVRNKMKQAIEPCILKRMNRDKSGGVKDDPWLKVKMTSAGKEKKIETKTTNNLERNVTPTAAKNEVELLDDDFNFDNFDQFDDDLSKNTDANNNDLIGDSNKNNDDFVDEKVYKKDDVKEIPFTKRAAILTNNIVKEDSGVSDADLSFEDELEEELNEVLGNEYDDGEADEDEIDMELHLDNDDGDNISDDNHEDIEGLEIVDDPFAHKRKQNTRTTDTARTSASTNNSDTRNASQRKTASKRTPAGITAFKSASTTQANEKSSNLGGPEELSDIELSLEEDLDDIDLDEEEISSEEE